MNKKNTILSACTVLFCACLLVLAQTKQQIKPEQSKKVASNVVTVSNSASLQQNTSRHNYKPKDGYVPHQQTAIAITVAVWKPIYGEEHIEKKKPYNASLKNGVWTVTGSLPEGWDGGVPEAEISKDDGRVLRVTHGK